MKRFFVFPAGVHNYFQDIDLQFSSTSPFQPVPAAVTLKLNPLADIRVVLWDIYGTLCGANIGDLEDSFGRMDAHRPAARAVIEHFSLEPALSGLAQATGLSSDQFLVDLYHDLIAQSHQHSKSHGIAYPEVHINQIWAEIIGRCCGAGYQLPADQPLEQVAYQMAYLYDCAFQDMSLYPDIAQCLDDLNRAGLIQGIISNAQFYTPLRLRHLLRQDLKRDDLELDSFFTEPLVYFSYELGYSKPNPLAFQKAISYLKTQGITTDKALFIGNDMLNDIAAARENGFQTMLFGADKSQTKLREDEERCRHVQPDAIVTQANQIAQLIIHD